MRNNRLFISQGLLRAEILELSIDLINTYDKTQNIYREAEALNHLQLTIQNNTENVISLKGGKVVPESSIDTVDTSAFYMNFSNILLNEGEFEALKISCTSHSTEWQFQSFDPNPGSVRNRAWAFVPKEKATIKLEPQEKLQFSITGFKFQSGSTTTDVSVDYHNIGEEDNDVAIIALSVFDPPVSGNKPFSELPLGCQFIGQSSNIAYLSTDTIKLQNSLIFSLFNQSNDPLVKASESEAKPYFRLSFIFSDRAAPGVLTTRLIERITISPLSMGRSELNWKIDKVPDETTGYPHWILTPKSDGILPGGRNASAEFAIQSLFVDGLPISCLMYLQGFNIPGYNPGMLATLIQKRVPEKNILRFFANQSIISRGEAVYLSWQTFAVDHVELVYTDHNGDTQQFTNWKSKPGAPNYIDTNEVAFKIELSKSTVFTLNIYPSDNDTNPSDSRQFSVTVKSAGIRIDAFSVIPSIISQDYFDKKKRTDISLAWSVANVKEPRSALVLQSHSEGKMPTNYMVEINKGHDTIPNITEKMDFQIFVNNQIFDNSHTSFSFTSTKAKTIAKDVWQMQYFAPNDTLYVLQAPGKILKFMSTSSSELLSSTEPTTLAPPVSGCFGIDANENMLYFTYLTINASLPNVKFLALMQYNLDSKKISSKRIVYTKDSLIDSAGTFFVDQYPSHLWATKNRIYIIMRGNSNLFYFVFDSDDFKQNSNKIIAINDPNHWPLNLDSDLIFTQNTICINGTNFIYAIHAGRAVQILQLRAASIIKVEQIRLNYDDANCLYLDETNYWLYIGYKKGLIAIIDLDTNRLVGELNIMKQIPKAMVANNSEQKIYVACENDVTLVLSLVNHTILQSWQGLGGDIQSLTLMQNELYQKNTSGMITSLLSDVV